MMAPNSRSNKRKGNSMFQCRFTKETTLPWGLSWMLLLALSFPLTAQPPAEEARTSPRPDAAEAYDLRIALNKDEAILIEIKTKMSGTVSMTLDGRTVKNKTDRTEQLTLVDQYTKIDDDNKHYEMSRYYAKALAKADGDIRDSSLNGAMIRYTQKDGQINLTLAEGRLFDVKLKGRLLTEYHWIGPWFALPGQQALNEEFSVDLAPLLLTVTGAEGEVVLEKSRFKLMSVDTRNNTASLEGAVEWKEIAEDEDMTGGIDYIATAEIKIDLEKKHLHSLNLKGTGNVYGKARTGNGEMGGSLAFSSAIVTKTGSAVTRVLKAKPTYRDVRRTIHLAGVQLSLPSHWAETAKDRSKSIVGYTRTLAPGNPVIQVQRLKIGDIPLDELMRQTETVMRGNGQSPVLKKVKSAISTGFSTDLDENGQHFHTEFYRLNRTDWLAYKLVSNKDMPKEAKREYDKGRKSLRLIKSN